MTLRILTFLTTVLCGTLQGQSLELYGIQVSIGMRSETVLRLFPASLTVEFDEKSSSYTISKHDEVDRQVRNLEYIGVVWTRNGRVTSIRKDYNPAAAGDIETAVRSLTGKTSLQNCAVTGTKDTDSMGTIRSESGRLDLRCGAYLIAVSFIDLFLQEDKPRKSYTFSIYLGR